METTTLTRIALLAPLPAIALEPITASVRQPLSGARCWLLAPFRHVALEQARDRVHLIQVTRGDGDD